MKPNQIFSSLKLLGIDLNTAIPAVEKALIDEWHKWETEAGSKLMAVAVLDETGNHLVVSLYRDAGGGNLSLYKSFPLSDISKIIKNLKNQNQNDTQQSAPERIAQPAEQSAEPAAKQLPAPEPGAGTII